MKKQNKTKGKVSVERERGYKVFRPGFGKVHPDGRDLGSGQVAGTAGAWARQMAADHATKGVISNVDGKEVRVPYDMNEPYVHGPWEGEPMQNVDRPTPLTTTQAVTQIIKSGKFVGHNKQGKGGWMDPMSPYFRSPSGPIPKGRKKGNKLKEQYKIGGVKTQWV